MYELSHDRGLSEHSAFCHFSCSVFYISYSACRDGKARQRVGYGAFRVLGERGHCGRGRGRPRPAGVSEEHCPNTRYKSEFLREFGNLSTFSFAMSIMGMTASIATTFTTPLRLAGFPSVVWCWIAGSLREWALYPDHSEYFLWREHCGNCLSVPYRGGTVHCHRVSRAPLVAAARRLDNGLPQHSGPDGGYCVDRVGTERHDPCCGGGMPPELRDPELAPVFALYVGGVQFYTHGRGLLTMHGVTNSLPTKYLARMTTYFVFVNIGVGGTVRRG